MVMCGTCEVPLPPTGCFCPCGKVSYCTSDCQRKDWKAHKPSCPPYKVVRQEGRGRGLVATRKLGVGEVVLGEIPLMVIDSQDSEVATEVFRVEWGEVEEEQRRLVLQLFDPVRDSLKQEQEEEVVRAQRIFAANSMQVCEVGALYSPTEGALYHHISLLNHSCIPNAVWSWSKGEYRRKVVRTMRVVGKGEELLVNYLDMEAFNLGAREDRRAALLDKFGFICRCSECGLEGRELETNEERRREVVTNLAAVKAFMETFDEKSTVAALRLGTSTVQVVKELGLVLELPRILLNMYQVATAARYQNIIGSANPAVYRDAALSFCSKFGDSFLHFFHYVCSPELGATRTTATATTTSAAARALTTTS